MSELDFSTFPPLAAEAWRDLITRDLKGRPYSSLRWTVEPDVVLEPFYTRHDVPDAPIAPTGPKARVLQYLPSGATPHTAQEAAAGGAEGFFVENDFAFPDGGPGLSAHVAPNLASMLTTGVMVTDGAIRLDGLSLHEAGATRVETLAWVAAQASAALAAQQEDTVRLEAFVGVGPAFVAETALLRALRVVLGNVARAYGHSEAVVHVTAVTSRYHLTAYAPHNNLLRNTLAAAAALVGGADALAVRPHDLLAGATADGLRLARQTHLLLRDESHLSRIADAAGGAYAVEVLTEQIARQAWVRFQQIEAAGGLFEAAETLELAQTVAAQHEARMTEVLSGSRRIVGVTRSPSAADTATLPDAPGEDLLPARRLATPFEALRHTVAPQAAGFHAALLLFGDPAQRSARANFTREFLAIAGLASAEVDASEAVPEDAALVVLCAGNEDYTAGAVEQVQARCPQAQIWVAGYPPEVAPALEAAGVRFFVRADQPLYAHLQHALAQLPLSA